MERPEVPIEAIQEHIHEHAHHSSGSPERKWVLGVALTSAIFAAFAAVAALLAGHHANEAMIDQIKSSDQWNYYQAKGIKAAVLANKIDVLTALGKEVNPKDEAKRKQYETDQEEIKHEAEHHEHDSEEHLTTHVAHSRAVTLFQIAITVAAISVLVNRRAFWLLSLAVGLVGIYFITVAFIGPLGAAKPAAHGAPAATHEPAAANDAQPAHGAGH